jgi:hypothetical protein
MQIICTTYFVTNGRLDRRTDVLFTLTLCFMLLFFCFFFKLIWSPKPHKHKSVRNEHGYSPANVTWVCTGRWTDRRRRSDPYMSPLFCRGDTKMEHYKMYIHVCVPKWTCRVTVSERHFYYQHIRSWKAITFISTCTWLCKIL